MATPTDVAEDVHLNAFTSSLEDVILRIIRALGRKELEEVKVVLRAGIEFCEVDHADYWALTAGQLITYLLDKHRSNPFIVVDKLLRLFEQHLDYGLEDMQIVELKQLHASMEQNLRRLNLEPLSLLIGRNEQLKQIKDILDGPLLRGVINICGVAGIGKSHLAKFLQRDLLAADVWRCIGIDGRSLHNVKDIVVAILHRIGSCSAGRLEDQQALLIAKLQYYCDQGKPLLVVIDDTSGLMPEEDQKRGFEFLTFLQQLMRKTPQNRKIKFVLTSRIKVVSLKDRSISEFSKTKSDAPNHVVDIELQPLTERDSLETLSVHLKHIPEDKRRQLAEACHGHPFVLSLLQTQAQCHDVDLLCNIDLHDVQHEVAEQLYDKAYGKIMDNMKKKLLALSVFEGKTEIKAFLGVYEPGLDKRLIKEMCKRMIDEFACGFWVSVEKSPDENEDLEHHLVSLYHPITREFLLHRAHSDHEWVQQVKDAFVQYFMRIVFKIGRDCIKNPSKAADLIGKNRLNINKCFGLVQHMPDFSVLIPDSIDKFSNLLCFFHELFEEFDLQPLLDTMSCQLKHENSMLRTKKPALLSITHALVATLCRHWECAQETLKTVFFSVHTLCQRNKILFHFICGLKHYLDGLILYDDPRYNGTATFLLEADGKLRLASERWRDVPKLFVDYFHTKSLISEGRVFLKLHLITGKSGGADYLKLSEKKFDKALTLHKGDLQECLSTAIYVELSAIFSVKGDSCNGTKAFDCYKKAQNYYDVVEGQLKAKNASHSAAAALSYRNKASMLRGWARKLTMKPDLSKDDMESAMKKLDQACDLGKQAIKCYQRLCTESNQGLLIAAYVQQARPLYAMFTMQDRLKIERPYTEYRKQSLNYLLKAYNLVVHTRACGLSWNDPVLKHLIEMLPKELEQEKTWEECDKVAANLQRIQQRLKEASESLISSLSSLCLSSSGSSDESLGEPRKRTYSSDVTVEEAGCSYNKTRRIDDDFSTLS